MSFKYVKVQFVYYFNQLLKNNFWDLEEKNYHRNGFLKAETNTCISQLIMLVISFNYCYKLYASFIKWHQRLKGEDASEIKQCVYAVIHYIGSLKYSIPFPHYWKLYATN